MKDDNQDIKFGSEFGSGSGREDMETMEKREENIIGKIVMKMTGEERYTPSDIETKLIIRELEILKRQMTMLNNFDLADGENFSDSGNLGNEVLNQLIKVRNLIRNMSKGKDEKLDNFLFTCQKLMNEINNHQFAFERIKKEYDDKFRDLSLELDGKIHSTNDLIDSLK